ncbi:hypothetical protein [uncultured archaeal virus]|uniref:Uncharacterized protein n=1 Tax=uncultured archaeal virus TaxID=1960247 RepID=A0A8B0LTR0_9VIRU|nr:hypothetical protein [uncultured archaeal virus]
MAIKPEDAIKKYKNNIDQTKYEKGVNAVKTSVTAAAIKQKESFIKNTLAGKDRLIKNLGKVSTDVWKTKTKRSFSKLEEKVILAIDSGKWNAAKVLAAGQSAHATAKNMKKGSYSDSYDRYLASQNAIKTAWK